MRGIGGFRGSERRFFMELEMYRKYSQMARGIEKAELVFKNGRVFSSGTGEFIVLVPIKERRRLTWKER